MYIAFLNPQGNFDAYDRYWTEHPDFGGQLVYVKQVARALAARGHQVDILTRQIADPAWPEFADRLDAYPASSVRIVRLSAGPPEFLPKEALWPHLVRDWVPHILAFYREMGAIPDIFTAHYGDGGLCAVLLEEATAIPFTFTGHSLGAQKLDKLHATRANLAALDARYHFAARFMAERLSMNRSAVNITSTAQERFEQYGHVVYRGAVDVHNAARFAVIPPGVDLTIFGSNAVAADEAATHAHIRAMLARDIAAHRRALPAIIASGRLDPKKNHLGLLQAFAESPPLQERVNLIIFSSALPHAARDIADVAPAAQEVLAPLRALIAAHHLEGKVSLFAVGGQTALAAAYRFFAARPGSVFALPAWYEPFGLAPLEAAAAGLPVVVTQNGGPSESFREGGVEYGVLVDPAAPADIARGLLRLVADATTWQQFARAGQQRVLDRYTWERTAQRYETQFAAIVSGPVRHTSLLPIPPCFRPVTAEQSPPLEELQALYFAESAP
ncbi:MAG TPA: glycosyltransferase [Anaerolineae bacterium]|nr:glycosyltransferase [Anaerolineae bacterium]